MPRTRWTDSPGLSGRHHRNTQVGTAYGLGRYDGETWRFFTTQNSDLPSGRIQALLESGILWVGTFGWGLARYDGEAWTVFTTLNSGLSSDVIFSLLESKEGGFWVGTDSGLVRLQRPPFPLTQAQIIRYPPPVLGDTRVVVETVGREAGADRPPVRLSAAVVPADRALSESDWSPLDVVQWRTPEGVVFGFLGGNAFEVSGLYNGPWTLYVRYTDRYGRFSAPASSTFRVDSTPPTAVVASPRAGDTVSGLVPIVGSVFDESPESDLEQYVLEYGQGSAAGQVEAWFTERIFDLTAGQVFSDTLARWDTEGLYGPYVLRLRVTDRLEHESRHSVSLQVAVAARVVDAEEGGRLSDGAHTVELYIPPRGLPQSTQVTLAPVVEKLLPADLNLRYAGLAYDIEPANLVFGRQTQTRFIPKPAVLTLRFQREGLPSRVAPARLALFRLSETDSAWAPVGGTVESMADGGLQLRVGLERAGRYALMEALPVSAPASLSNLACQPRVFGQGTGLGADLTILFELGGPSAVTVKVYDPSGRLQRKVEDRLMNQGSNAVVWDGRDEDGDPVPSGLYIVTVEAGGTVKTRTVGMRNR